MMGFSCMKAVYKHTLYLHSRKKYYYLGVSLTRKQASQRKKYLIKKFRRSDPIRCLAMVKLARSVFAYKKKTVLARASYSYRAKHS